VRPNGRRGDGFWLLLFLALVIFAKPAADAAEPPHHHKARQPNSHGASLAKVAPPLGPASGNVVRLALAQARRMHASPKVRLSLIEAGLVESNLRNLPYGDRDSLGYLQQRPSQGWRCPRNITCATWDFLRRAIPLEHQYSTAGRLAQAVQRSAFPARYNQRRAQALRVIASYQHGGR
jgi:hypothetical protein